MAIQSAYETVKQAIQDVIAPQIQDLKGEIAGLRGEMRQLKKRMEEGFASVRSEIASVRNKVFSTNRRRDETVDIRERPAALEAVLVRRRR